MKGSTMSAGTVQASKGRAVGLWSPACPWSYSRSSAAGAYYAKGQVVVPPCEVREHVCSLTEGDKIVDFSLDSEFPLVNEGHILSSSFRHF